MTTTTTARRPVVGWLIALAGLVAAIAILFVYVAPSIDGAWLAVISDAALTLAFLFLFLGRTAPLVLRTFFLIAAVGWAILTINGVIGLGPLLTVGLVLALAGSLISGILAFARRLFSSAANLLFLLATIVIAVVLLNQLIAPFVAITLGLLAAGIYALLLLLAGITIALRK
jgi:hypothetical protein